MTHVDTGTILDEILARTTADLTERKITVPVSELEARARSRPVPLSLRAALAGPEMSVIAEIKRASPSRGKFPVAVEPATVARDYILGGAAAISVLTDQPFFQGSLGDLDATAGVAHTGARSVPVLRKDFVVDPYQIAEARAYGADAVLLIVAALDGRQLTDLLAAAAAWGMDALVEVHDERESETRGGGWGDPGGDQQPRPEELFCRSRSQRAAGAAGARRYRRRCGERDIRTRRSQATA